LLAMRVANQWSEAASREGLLCTNNTFVVTLRDYVAP
jgi:hypothetical protein